MSAVLRLEANGPFDHRAALATLAAHAVHGLEEVDPHRRTVTRLHIVRGREAAVVTVALDSGGATVRTPGKLPRAEVALLADGVRRRFDLDADVAAADAHLGDDPVFAAQVRRRPGIRVTRYPAPFEALVLIILGQQVTTAAGRTFGARLVAAYGDPGPDGADGLHLFPTPRRLAGTPAADLRTAVGLTRSRAATVHAAAGFFADDSPDGAALPSRSALARVAGIGPWTLDCLAARAGDDPDVFPGKDAALARILHAAGVGDPATAAARWSPYRSYAASRLRAAAHGAGL